MNASRTLLDKIITPGLCFVVSVPLLTLLAILTLDTVYDNVHKENSHQNPSITMEFLRALNYTAKN